MNEEWNDDNMNAFNMGGMGGNEGDSDDEEEEEEEEKQEEHKEGGAKQNADLADLDADVEADSQKKE
jgi:hypothetical protein